jgi:hypothetical protein
LAFPIFFQIFLFFSVARGRGMQLSVRAEGTSVGAGPSRTLVPRRLSLRVACVRREAACAASRALNRRSVGMVERWQVAEAAWRLRRVSFLAG